VSGRRIVVRNEDVRTVEAAVVQNAAGQRAAGAERPVPDDVAGAPIEGELYDVPMDKLANLLATEPPVLELSIVTLQDGELSFGMVVRAGAEVAAGATDITEIGSWRHYLEGDS
jgi:hypothetical protein